MSCLVVGDLCSAAGFAFLPFRRVAKAAVTHLLAGTANPAVAALHAGTALLAALADPGMLSGLAFITLLLTRMPGMASTMWSLSGAVFWPMETAHEELELELKETLLR